MPTTGKKRTGSLPSLEGAVCLSIGGKRHEDGTAERQESEVVGSQHHHHHHHLVLYFFMESSRERIAISRSTSATKGSRPDGSHDVMVSRFKMPRFLCIPLSSRSSTFSETIGTILPRRHHVMRKLLYSPSVYSPSLSPTRGSASA